jgi:hypothetical protein
MNQLSKLSRLSRLNKLSRLKVFLAQEVARGMLLPRVHCFVVLAQKKLRDLVALARHSIAAACHLGLAGGGIPRVTTLSQ